MAPWGRLGGPWEQQEGHLGFGVDMLSIAGRFGNRFFEFVGHRGPKLFFVLPGSFPGYFLYLLLNGMWMSGALVKTRLSNER